MAPRYNVLIALSVVEMLAMSLWFGAAAVIPQLRLDWQLTDLQAGALTMAVQAGFVAGTLISAGLNLPDRWPAERLIAVCCLAAGVTTWALTGLSGPGSMALALRFLTGAFLAGVYPPGMKIVASWFRTGRGLGVGILVGALTLGKAIPYLLNASGVQLPPWQWVLSLSAALAIVAGVLTLMSVRQGPELARAANFHVRHALAGLRHRPTRLANFGYFGHMWELYAMWTWMPMMLLTAYARVGAGAQVAAGAAFSAIAVGALGCAAAGALADRIGRTAVTMTSLAVSGACCLVVGGLMAHPVALTAVCLLWGFAVVADSAQFSAAVTELADERYVGTALTMQTCLGFLLTLGSLWLVPWLAAQVGWEWAFVALAPGPLFGFLAMARLRTLPESRRLAHGLR